MRVLDILEDADQAIPNSVPTQTKVRWLNEIQDELWPRLDFPRAEATISLTPGESRYDLPSDCRPERIQQVYLNVAGGFRVQLPHRDYANAGSRRRYWYSIDPSGRKIVLSSAPNTEGWSLDIHYIRPFKKISIEPGEGELGLDDEPEIPMPFHSIYVWGLAARIAAAAGDVEAEQAHIQRFRASFDHFIRNVGTNPDRGFVVQIRW